MLPRRADGYIAYRKSPRQAAAGLGFLEPSFALPLEWLETRAHRRCRIQAKGSPLAVAHSGRQRLDAERALVSRRDPGLIQAGPKAVLDSWIGYYRPYATSHEDLDADPDTFTQVTNAALALAEMVRQIRSGQYQAPDKHLESPREK